MDCDLLITQYSCNDLHVQTLLGTNSYLNNLNNTLQCFVVKEMKMKTEVHFIYH